jgi:Holliday junction resolvase RusA-like endonuclease
VTLRLTVPGRPRAKQRPRFGQGRTYTPTMTERYEGEIWILAVACGAKSGMFQDRPLQLTVKAYFAPSSRVRQYPQGCDVDNLLKIVADGLSPTFRDDAQIVRWSGEKQFGVPERLEVELTDEAIPG